VTCFDGSRRFDEQIDLVDEGPSNSLGGDDHPYLARQLSVF
jgi:hypothetical protein